MCTFEIYVEVGKEVPLIKIAITCALLKYLLSFGYATSLVSNTFMCGIIRIRQGFTCLLKGTWNLIQVSCYFICYYERSKVLNLELPRSGKVFPQYIIHGRDWNWSIINDMEIIILP